MYLQKHQLLNHQDKKSIPLSPQKLVARWASNFEKFNRPQRIPYVRAGRIVRKIHSPQASRRVKSQRLLNIEQYPGVRNVHNIDAHS